MVASNDMHAYNILDICSIEIYSRPIYGMLCSSVYVDILLHFKWNEMKNPRCPEPSYRKLYISEILFFQ